MSHRKEKVQCESLSGLGHERPLGVDATFYLISVPGSWSSYFYLS